MTRLEWHWLDSETIRVQNEDGGSGGVYIDLSVDRYIEPMFGEAYKIEEAYLYLTGIGVYKTLEVFTPPRVVKITERAPGADMWKGDFTTAADALFEAFFPGADCNINGILDEASETVDWSEALDGMYADAADLYRD